MALDKAILYGKEKRRPYYGSRRFDSSCRPGGDCPWCRENNLYATKKNMAKYDLGNSSRYKGSNG